MAALKKETTEVFMITGNWTEQCRLLKRRFPLLIDADLKYVEGEENDLLKRLEFRLHKKRDEVMSIIRQVRSSRV